MKSNNHYDPEELFRLTKSSQTVSSAHNTKITNMVILLHPDQQQHQHKDPFNQHYQMIETSLLGTDIDRWHYSQCIHVWE